MEDGKKAMSKANLDDAKTIEAIETKTIED